MANKKSKKDNKGVIIGICCAVVVLVVVIVAIVMATRGNQLNDSYFVSDDTKYVLTFETDATEATEEGEADGPVKMHMVYTYSGDDITGVKSYYEFANDETAKKYYDLYMQEGNDGTFKSVSLDGKYVIMEANDDDYKDMKASDVKAQVEMLEAVKNGNFDADIDDATEIEDVETVETTEDTDTVDE